MKQAVEKIIKATAEETARTVIQRQRCEYGINLYRACLLYTSLPLPFRFFARQRLLCALAHARNKMPIECELMLFSLVADTTVQQAVIADVIPRFRLDMVNGTQSPQCDSGQFAYRLRIAPPSISKNLLRSSTAYDLRAFAFCLYPDLWIASWL